MDVTQRMNQTPIQQRHQLQHQMSEPVFSRTSAAPEDPPPPAPSASLAAVMVPPLPSHVNQRRVVEAVVRTNPRLRHQHSHPAPHHAQQQVPPPPPQYQMPFYHHQRATLHEIMQQRQQQMQQQQQQQQHRHPMQRFHSEESLASRGGYDGHHGGLYSSRIHSSADEISSLNRSPSMTSDDDQGSVQQSRLSSQYQCCNLPQLSNTQKNVPFHLNLHLRVFKISFK